MAFEHNDIATKNRLMSGLGEELMGFEHNDIVTMDVMNKAIEEGGGGGETGTKWSVIVNAVPMESTKLTAERLEREDDGGVILDAIPFYNGVPFYSLNLPADNGLTDTEIDFHIYDGYTGDAPITIKVYYNASYTAEVTGNITATHDEYDFIFTITGDGTITITAA